MPTSETFQKSTVEKERPKSYNNPQFHGPVTTEELLIEAKTADPHTLYFDLKFNRSREMMIFMEETKIWQELLQDCVDRAGVNASKVCNQLREMVEERNQYYNSNFNAAMRPKLTPGIPIPYDRILIDRSNK